MTNSANRDAAATGHGYAIGHLTNVEVNNDLLNYMAEVESTMMQFGGRWLVHGSTPDVREGRPFGDVVIIQFPDMSLARAWYESAAYQEIIRLRTENSTSWIALLEGVSPNYSSHTTIEKLRSSL